MDSKNAYKQTTLAEIMENKSLYVMFSEGVQMKRYKKINQNAENPCDSIHTYTQDILIEVLSAHMKYRIAV